MGKNSSGYFDKTGKEPKPFPKISRLWIILGVLVAPLLLLVIVVYPVIVTNNSQKYEYKLPKNFTRADVDTFVAKMRKDAEYQFYFKVLGDSSIDRATGAAYEVFDKAREKGEFLQQIKQSKEKIQSTAVLLNTLTYPEDFVKNPLAYTDLAKKLWDFIDQEFELTILGLCYKSTYDADFQFHWSAAAKQSAHKVEGILYTLTAEQRKQIEQAVLQ